MSFLVSPGVHVREIDLTNVVPSVQTTIGAIAAPFQKGPISSVTSVSSEEELLELFGKPQGTSNQFEHWFSAANFLQTSPVSIVEKVKLCVSNSILMIQKYEN